MVTNTKQCMLHREVTAVTSERERGRVVSTVTRLHLDILGLAS